MYSKPCYCSLSARFAIALFTGIASGILQVEEEIALLEKELTPVERFAVNFLEQTDDQFSEEAIKEAEVRINSCTP